MELKGDGVTTYVVVEEMWMWLYNFHNVLCSDFVASELDCVVKEKKVDQTKEKMQ